jgi:RNA polymerase sigma factor (sigma-70 family)
VNRGAGTGIACHYFGGTTGALPDNYGKFCSREGSAGLSQAGEVTELLREWSSGRPEAIERLFEVVYPQLRQIAGALLRGQRRQKRDGGVAVPLDEKLAWIGAASVELMDLDRVLEELNQLDARKCKMVELRFFLGFSAEETADLLNTSKATVDRELKFARGWLYERLHYSPD